MRAACAGAGRGAVSARGGFSVSRRVGRRAMARGHWARGAARDCIGRRGGPVFSRVFARFRAPPRTRTIHAARATHAQAARGAAWRHTATRCAALTALYSCGVLFGGFVFESNFVLNGLNKHMHAMNTVDTAAAFSFFIFNFFSLQPSRAPRQGLHAHLPSLACLMTRPVRDKAVRRKPPRGHGSIASHPPRTQHTSSPRTLLYCGPNYSQAHGSRDQHGF